MDELLIIFPTDSGRMTLTYASHRGSDLLQGLDQEIGMRNGMFAADLLTEVKTMPLVGVKQDPDAACLTHNSSANQITLPASKLTQGGASALQGSKSVQRTEEVRVEDEAKQRRAATTNKESHGLVSFVLYFAACDQGASEMSRTITYK